MAEIPNYDNTVYFITVYSPNVSIPGGIYPGMPIKKLLAMKGVKGNYQEHFCIEYQGYSIDWDYDSLTPLGEKAFNDAYLNGTEVKLTNACFKENAKVFSLSMF